MNLELRDFAIRSIGCIACLLYGVGKVGCEKHHLNDFDKPGGKRRGELFTIGLCRWHHVGACTCPGKHGVIRDCATCHLRFGPSWYHRKRLFLITFGTGDELLSEQNSRINDQYGARLCQHSS
jgi:hypothetical protein